VRKGTVRPNGSEIVRRREEKGWTQEDLEGEVGCGIRTIQRAEASKPVLLRTVVEIAKALGCEPKGLFGVRAPTPEASGDPSGDAAADQTRTHGPASMSTLSAGLCVSRVLSSPISGNAISALMHALREGEKVHILSSAHLFLGLMSVDNGLAQLAIRQSGDDATKVEQLVRSCVQPQGPARETPVTKTVQDILEHASSFSRGRGVLLDERHLLGSLFKFTKQLANRLIRGGFKVDAWLLYLAGPAAPLETPYRDDTLSAHAREIG